MSIEKVVFPSFRDDNFTSFDMRQLVSALEHRFNALENEVLDDESSETGDYAPLSHTHEVDDITDLDLSSYLTGISEQSIFDLSDVSGSGSNRKTLVWEGGGSGGFTTRNFYLSELEDTDLGGIADGDRIAWDATSSQFVPVAAGDDLTVDLTNAEDHDLLYNDNGTWKPTEAEMQWNPDTSHLLFGNDVPVKWRNAAYTDVELLIFDSADDFTIGDPSYDTIVDGSALTVNPYVDFPEQAAPSAPAADNVRLWAADEQGAHSFLHWQDGNGIDIEVSRDTVHIVRNTSGSTIDIGKVVYATGSTGNVPTVALADASVEATMPPYGVTMESIANNAFGLVMQQGDLTGLDLSAYTEGDELYVSETAGELTATEPAKPAIQFHMGTVLKNTASGILSVSMFPPAGVYAELNQNETVSGNWEFTGTLQIDDGAGNALELSHTGTNVNAAVVGTTNYLQLLDGLGLRIFDSTDTDYAAFDHDGTDFITDFSGTTDWNITGLSGRLLPPITRYNDDVVLLFGTDEDFGIDFNSAGSVLIIEDRLTNNTVRFSEGALAKLELDHSAEHLWLRDGYTLRVSDATDADYIEISHNGTDLDTTFVGTADWNIGSASLDRVVFNHGGGTGIIDLFNAMTLRLWDSTNSDRISMQHDGTDFVMDFAGTADLQITGLNNNVQIRDGANLRIYDSTDADYAAFYHDGTDFITTTSNTGDWHISGIARFTITGDTIDNPSIEVIDSSGNAASYYMTGDTYSGRLMLNGAAFQFRSESVSDITELQVRSGIDFRIYDSTESDSALFDHDGTDFNTTFTGTTDWNIASLSKLKLLDGCGLVFYDSADADASQFYHDGTDLILEDIASTTRGLRIGGLSLYLQEQGAAGSDSAAFGQLWVKNDTPNVLYFTDDAGTDHNLLSTSGASASDAATYNSAGVWWFEYEVASVTAGTWYTIATNPSSLDITVAPTGAGGSRAEGHFVVSDTVSGKHSFVEFTVAHHYGLDPVVHVLKASSFGGTPMAHKIRVVELGTYDGVAVQVLAGATGNMNVLMRSPLQVPGFTIQTPTAETPEGTWNLETFDLTSQSGTDVAWGLLTANGSADYDHAGNFHLIGSELRVFHNDGHANKPATFGRADGQHIEFEVNDNAGYIRYVQDETDATSHFLQFDIQTSNTGSRYVDFAENGTAKFRISHSADRVEVRDGYSFNVYDAGNTDFMGLSHNGTNFYFSATNTNWMIFDGQASGWLFDGGEFNVRQDGVGNTLAASTGTGTNADHLMGMVSGGGDNMAIMMNSYDGARDAKSGIFHDDVALEFGSTQTWSAGGQMDWVLYMGNSEKMRYDTSASRLDVTGAITASNEIEGRDLSTTNTSSTAQYGVGLYGGTGSDPTYGILFTGTVGYGTHGGVTGNWGVYFNMNNDSTRGWLFRNVTTGPVASITAAGVMYLDGELYIGGDTIGHFESVTGNYGSVQVDGADGSSGTWRGYSIGGRLVFMEDGSVNGGIYNDTDNEWYIKGNRNGSVDLYHNGGVELQTQPHEGTGNTSGASVYDHTAAMRDVGFNVLPIQTEDVSDTLEAKHCGGVFFKDGTTARTLTLEASTSTDFPIGGVCTIINAGSSGNITVSEGSGTTLYVLEGSGGRTDSAGGCTVAPGSVATLWREASTIYYIFGNGVTP